MAFTNPYANEAFSDEHVVSVSELNGMVRNVLESEPMLQHIEVQGEISNLTRHRSGHYYFSIKDKDSQLSAVMFRQHVYKNDYNDFDTGDNVILTGGIKVYAPRGQYQMQVTRVRPAGLGELYRKFLELKAKLEAAGLFHEMHKREVPPFPRRIGVITSQTGAVLHDILNTLNRRYRAAEVLLLPATVQGSAAVPTLLRAFELVQQIADLDVVLLARGGGSMEDLWCFNDERLAHAIFNCPVPVISAIGHETDFTIADFVADVRAPTPTAAAELAAPRTADLLYELASWRATLKQHAQQRLNERFQQLDELGIRLRYAATRKLDAERANLARQQAGLTQHARTKLAQEKRQLVEQRRRLKQAALSRVQQERNTLALLNSRLQAGDVKRLLERGFTLTMKDGKIVRTSTELQPGDTLTTRFSDGEVDSTVN
ncbi:MAG: exodeoxyribonuclease VII large subunit [Bacteroidota bacterium]